MSKRKKKGDAAAEPAVAPAAPEAPAPVSEDVTPVTDAFDQDEDTVVNGAPMGDPAAFAAADPGDAVADDWEGPTREAATSQLEELAAKSVEATEAEASAAPPAEAVEASSDGGLPMEDDDDAPPPEALAAPGRLESVLESLLFVSDRALTLVELKRLVGERDGAKITAAMEALRARRADTGVQVMAVSGGWHLRTNPENVAWVSRLVAGKPQRLSRAMLETLSIVAYRQPITRPEIDDIRGVDCGPVLKTLLDRGLVRMIGKKEEAGRPILYGTTPEFLRIFSLRDLSELPTLREFHELGVAEAERVAAIDAESRDPVAAASPEMPRPAPLPTEPDVDDELLSELDRAAEAAADASKPMNEQSDQTNPSPDATEPA
jgi:segregation and condensation protein B